jgi:2-isopropylmalate synthase
VWRSVRRGIGLVDSKVRLVRTEEQVEEHTLSGTSMAVRVIIDSVDRGNTRHGTVSTVGVGTNMVEATWRALVDAVEYKLATDDERWRSGEMLSAGAHLRRSLLGVGSTS